MVRKYLRQPDIPLVIHSGGGCTDAARAIADLLTLVPRPTIALGKASSSALLVFAAGEPRIATPSSVFLHHEPYWVMEQDMTYLQEQVERMRKDLAAWWRWACSFLASRTERSTSWWVAAGKREGGTIGFRRALEIGLVQKELTKEVLDSFNGKA